MFTIVVFECMGWQVVIRGIFIMCIIVLLCQSVLVKNLILYQLIHVYVIEKDKRCWVGLFECGMHALNVLCVTHCENLWCWDGLLLFMNYMFQVTSQCVCFVWLLGVVYLDENSWRIKKNSLYNIYSKRHVQFYIDI